MPHPVLIFNSVQQIALAVARSLDRRAIPVTFADIGAPGGFPASRAIRDYVKLPHYLERPAEFREELVELIRSGGYDTIVPASDAGLVAVSQSYEDLKSLVRVCCPRPEVVERVLDKDRTMEAAVACGISVPADCSALDLHGLEEARGRLRFPIIAKPRSKSDERRHAFKAHYFANYGELRDAFLVNAAFGTQNLLQEFFPGDGVGIEALMHEGNPLVLFQHRRVKELPFSGGGSVLCVSEPLDGALAEMAVALLRKIEWEGVAMVEFRFDRNTGKSALLEVNGRYWGSLPLAIKAGLDFPYYEWQLAHGEKPVIPKRYWAGVQLRWFLGDVRRLCSLFDASSLEGFTLPSKWSETVRFVRDTVVPTAPAIFAWRDPLPAIKEYKSALRVAAGTLYRQVANRLRKLLAEYRYFGRRTAAMFLQIRLLYALGLKRDRRAFSGKRFCSVLFVCQGNKIRSPMAEALFLRQVRGHRWASEITACSAGLAPEPEARADQRARILAREFGVSLEEHRPQKLSNALVEQADVIFIMDNLNEAQMRVLYPGAMNKVFYVGAYAEPKLAVRNAEIADPNEGTLAEMRACCTKLQACVERVVEMIEPPSDRGNTMRQAVAV